MYEMWSEGRGARLDRLVFVYLGILFSPVLDRGGKSSGIFEVFTFGSLLLLFFLVCACENSRPGEPVSNSQLQIGQVLKLALVCSESRIDQVLPHFGPVERQSRLVQDQGEYHTHVHGLVTDD